MQADAPSSSDILDPGQVSTLVTMKTNPGQLALADGRVLFSTYEQRAECRIVETPFGRRDMGRIICGPRQEWIRDPDGSEYRASHAQALFEPPASAGSEQAPRRTFLSRLFGRFHKG